MCDRSCSLCSLLLFELQLLLALLHLHLHLLHAAFQSRVLCGGLSGLLIGRLLLRLHRRHLL